MTDILVLFDSIQDFYPILQQAGYTIHTAYNETDKEEIFANQAIKIKAVITRGTIGLSDRDIHHLPDLEIICAIGTGYENIDLKAAYDRNIVVTNGAGLNAISVAEHAMALMLSAVKQIPQADRSVKNGEWDRQPRFSLDNKRIGIFGLGKVGLEIAKKAFYGFNMQVLYFNRNPKSDVTYTYCSSLKELAIQSDVLIIAAPGGSATFNVVNEDILNALGSDSYLINIGRGSIVDTPALIKALKNKDIAGAALDVIDTEPDVPLDLASLDNVILTPHIAGRSKEAVAASVQLIIDNLSAHFQGRNVLTPVSL